jgi:predicted ArsR family transcriptional regulator
MPPLTENDQTPTPEAPVTQAGMRVVRLLVGKPPQSVADLIEATGVTRTAVTEQLNELLAGGFVERTTEQPDGRGRPRHLYRATNASLAFLFAGNQQLLVPALWEAIEEAGGEELKRKVLKRVSRKMAKHYKPRITGKTPRERLAQLADVLREEGCVVELDDRGNGQVVLRKRSCQFFSMFENTRSVCLVEHELLRSLLRTPIRQTASRHDGDVCCAFAIKLDAK